MAHIHDLEWEVGSRRIICVYDDCEFCMEAKDIIALVSKHAAQHCVQSDGSKRIAGSPVILDDSLAGDEVRMFRRR